MEIKISAKEAFDRYVQDNFPNCGVTWSEWEKIFSDMVDKNGMPYCWYLTMYGLCR